MKRSMRNLLVITSATSLVAALSLGLTGCKKHQPSEATSNGSSQNAGAQNSALATSSGHAGAWSAKDAQVAVGQAGNPSNSIPSSGNPSNVGESSGATPGSNTTATSTGSSGVLPGGSAGLTPAGTAAGSNTPAGSTTSSIAEAPKEIPVTCFVETFKHKTTAGHDSEEACSHHKNLVSLSHKTINPKSVCVRVNDTPVKFQSVTGGELLIGSIAGPKATISVSYCTGKNTCEFTKKNDCVVPKDEFLDAIGGSDTDEGAVAQWENTGNTEADAKLNNDVKRELADIDDAAPEHAGSSVFKDWTNEKTSPSCGQATAKK